MLSRNYSLRCKDNKTLWLKEITRTEQPLRSYCALANERVVKSL